MVRKGLCETARGFWGWECLRIDRGSLEVFAISRTASSQEEILATVLHALLGCFSPFPATKSPQQAQLDPLRQLSPTPEMHPDVFFKPFLGPLCPAHRAFTRGCQPSLRKLIPAAPDGFRCGDLVQRRTG